MGKERLPQAAGGHSPTIHPILSWLSMHAEDKLTLAQFRPPFIKRGLNSGCSECDGQGQPKKTSRMTLGATYKAQVSRRNSLGSSKVWEGILEEATAVSSLHRSGPKGQGHPCRLPETASSSVL